MQNTSGGQGRRYGTKRLMVGLFAGAVWVAMTACATIGGSAHTKREPVVYTVKVDKGDTLASIAMKFDTDWRQIVKDNGLGQKRELRVGQVLRVRPGPGGLAAGAAVTQTASPVAKLPTTPASASEPRWSEEDLDGSKAESADADANDAPAPDQKSRRGLLFGSDGGDSSQTTFKWPVMGSISSPFGPRWGRFHNGIDIRAGRGTPIKAAFGGQVIFSGRQHGYGNTVVINHGHYRTLYGHCGKLTIKKGAWVDGGAIVGLVGTSGNSRGVHLHFEIRTAGNRPIDPQPLLEKRLISQKDFYREEAVHTGDYLASNGAVIGGDRGAMLLLR